MTLPLPKLDTANYDALVNDALALLPRYAPEWTDYNAHDPGITLIELFAWLTEMESYRLDRVTEASIRAFLRLLGIEPRPAQVAENIVIVESRSLGSPVKLTPRQIFEFDGNNDIKFQTTQQLRVSRAILSAVLSGPLNALVDHTSDNSPSIKRYAAFGPEPSIGDALYLGFDRPLAVDPCRLNLYIWCGDAEKDRQIKRMLVCEAKAAAAHAKKCQRMPRPCGSNTRRSGEELFAIEPESKGSCCGPQSHPPSWRSHYAVQTIWEYYDVSNKWLPLGEVSDRTRSLTLSGPVRIAVPDPAKHIGGGVSGNKYSSLYFIRCRIARGSYDCPPQIRFVAINTVRARHAVDRKQAVIFGKSSGRAGQTYNLPDAPIVSASTRLELVDGVGTDKNWQEKLTWDRVGPWDKCYVLDPERGEVSFGNGRVGQVPPAGSEITVNYQTGGGPTGNVPAGSTWSSDNPDIIRLSLPFAAFGGAPAETLFAAKARAVEWLNTPHRAVTLEDFEKLALATPGVPVARAKALADYDPKLTCVRAPGSVTVVIVPECVQNPHAPGPDMLGAVWSYLDRRRLLTTGLHVIGPEYTQVAVYATLHAKGNVSSKQLISQATSALNQYFDPLTGSQDGKGWTLGRAVYRSEILALLNAVPAVTYVDGVFFEMVDDDFHDSCGCSKCQNKSTAGLCGNVEICPHGLIKPGQHQLKTEIEGAVQC